MHHARQKTGTLSSRSEGRHGETHTVGNNMKLTSPSPFASHLSPNLALSVIAIIVLAVPSSSSSSASCTAVNLSSSSLSPDSPTSTCFIASKSNCPDGPSFTWTVLDPLQSAVKLIISGCQLKSVQASEGQDMPVTVLQNLEELQLNGNHLQELPAGFMSNHMLLKIVYLQDNKLEILPRDFLKGCLRMEKLLLHNNKLVHLPSFIKLPLKVLTLYNNQLVCDCPLYIMLRHKRVLLLSGDVAQSPQATCHNPAELSGQAIANVSRETVCSRVTPFSKWHLVVITFSVALFMVSAAVVLAGLCLRRSLSYRNYGVASNFPISQVGRVAAEMGHPPCSDNDRRVRNAYVTSVELSPPPVTEDVYENVREHFGNGTDCSVGVNGTDDSDNYIGEDEDDDENDYQNL